MNPSPAEPTGQSLLVGRLHSDPAVARHAAFALFALVYLQQAGLVRRHSLEGEPAPDEFRAALTEVAAQNPHLFRFFSAAGRAAMFSQIDPGAARELLGWTVAQRVE